jgi:solute carrier family 45 protein 1/2/4
MEKPQEDGNRGRLAANAGRRADPSPGPSSGPRPSHTRVASTPAYLHPGFLSDGERQPLLRARSMDDGDVSDQEAAGPVAGGTVLGIHNLAIVMPQFVISIIASIIFKVVDGAAPPAFGEEPEHTYLGKTGVGWVLRFGGLCTLVGELFH